MEIKSEEIDLEKNAKKLYDLVQTEKFNVKEVVSKSSATKIEHTEGAVIGGMIPTDDGGYTSELVLKVSPVDEDIPINKLVFNGISNVISGDYISAKIPRVEVKREPFGERFFYHDRDYESVESAIEIAILSKDEKVVKTDEAAVLRTDRAVEYNKFNK